jgi:hypothetical protein
MNEYDAYNSVPYVNSEMEDTSEEVQDKLDKLYHNLKHDFNNSDICSVEYVKWPIGNKEPIAVNHHVVKDLIGNILETIAIDPEDIFHSYTVATLLGIEHGKLLNYIHVACYGNPALAFGISNRSTYLTFHGICMVKAFIDERRPHSEMHSCRPKFEMFLLDDIGEAHGLKFYEDL